VKGRIMKDVKKTLLGMWFVLLFILIAVFWLLFVISNLIVFCMFLNLVTDLEIVVHWTFYFSFLIMWIGYGYLIGMD